jgi:hypothetical protein
LGTVAKQSHSNQAILKKIRDFAFGSPYPLPVSDGFDMETQGYSDAEYKQRKDLLKGIGIDSRVLAKITDRILRSITQTGNAWIKIRVAQFAGATSVTFSAFNPSLMSRVKLKGSNKNYCVKVSEWKSEYQKDEVKLYPCSVDGEYHFKQVDGAFETVLQLKNDTGESDVYGSPYIESFVYWLLLEWQMSEYSNREVGNDFMAKLLVLFEDMPLGGLSENEKATALKKARLGASDVMSKQSTESSGIALMGFPSDSKHAPQAIALPPMTNELFYGEMLHTASRVVHLGYQTSMVITGYEKPASGLGLNSFRQEFELWNGSTLKGWQSAAQAWWRDIFECVNAIAQLPQLETMTVAFNTASDNLRVENAPPAMEAAQLGTYNQLLIAYGQNQISKAALIETLVTVYNFNEEKAQLIATKDGNNIEQ